MGVEIEYSPIGGVDILNPTGPFIMKQRIFESLYADDCVLLATDNTSPSRDKGYGCGSARTATQYSK